MHCEQPSPYTVPRLRCLLYAAICFLESLVNAMRMHMVRGVPSWIMGVMGSKFASVVTVVCFVIAVVFVNVVVLVNGAVGRIDSVFIVRACVSRELRTSSSLAISGHNHSKPDPSLLASCHSFSALCACCSLRFFCSSCPKSFSYPTSPFNSLITFALALS
jgi:hypothetical protein